MAGRSAEEVKKEIGNERERLGDAVQALRTQAGRTARRTLPLVAAGAAGAGLVVRTVGKRVSGRKGTDTQKRAHFPFRRRD